MTTKTLHYFTRSVYGVSQVYLDSTHAPTAEIAAFVIGLTGRKTLTETDFQCLLGLGFMLTQVIDPKTRRA